MFNTNRWLYWVGASTLVCLIAACAAPVQYAPSRLAAPAAAVGQEPNRSVEETLVVKLPTGFKREIGKGSLWRAAGAIAEGEVFRPVGTVFTIEGRQVHEAWLVVSGGTLVGFYLPGDQAYSALASPLPLKLGGLQ